LNTYATAEVCVRAPIDRCFTAATTDANMIAAFDGAGPIPGIDRIENLGPQLEVGLERIIHSSDGSTLRERVVALTPPNHMAYELSGFQGAFRYLVQTARADWTFTESGEYTFVRWDYAFTATGPLAWPIVRLLMPFFTHAQVKALTALEELVLAESRGEERVVDQSSSP
jgi:hypothetical protein